METLNVKKVRKSYFAKKYDLDYEMQNILSIKQDGTVKKNEQSHKFLTNAASQNVYHYLIGYLLAFSKKWLGKDTLKILDWGCGKGHVSYWLKKQNMDVISCDIAEDNVTTSFGQYAPLIQYGNIDIIPLQHQYILPFESETFDVVLSFGVLEHVSNDFESMKEIRRILKPRGLFYCFFLPYMYSYTQRISHLRGQFYHDHLYNYELIKDLLRCSNMKLLDIWHRPLLPKNSITPLFYRSVDRIDNWFCFHTILKHLATNIEFVAYKH
jgi:2-polyprenyl-3-methyl-5-hydroxy-6-metoxy-1,4-benzoquinol methylase